MTPEGPAARPAFLSAQVRVLLLLMLAVQSAGPVWYLISADTDRVPDGPALALAVGLLGSVAAILALPLAGLLALFRKSRRVAGQLGLLCLAWLACTALARAVVPDLRAQGIEQLTRRVEPAIGALHAYERTHGKPPAKLEQLVPEFLPALPGTGYPRTRLQYSVAPEGESWEGNRWELSCELPRGGFIAPSDRLSYHPNGRYGRGSRGRGTELINGWQLDRD